MIYLAMIVTVGFWYATSRTLISNDMALTLTRLDEHRTLFASAIVVGALGFVDFLVLGLVLYRLLHPFGRTAATLLVAFVAASVPLLFAAAAREMDVLSLIDAARHPPALGLEQVRLQAMLAVHGYNNLFLTSSIFSGLWIIPLGWLVIRSRIAPAAVGVLLIVGSVFYIAAFVGAVFDPQFETSLIARVIGIASGIPALLGELGVCIWLLVRRNAAIVSVDTRAALAD